jgi:hypothetical protein
MTLQQTYADQLRAIRDRVEQEIDKVRKELRDLENDIRRDPFLGWCTRERRDLRERIATLEGSWLGPIDDILGS